MTLQDLIQQVNDLPIADRQQLVESALASIQQETQVKERSASEVNADRPLHPWTQSLVGVIKPSEGDDTAIYINYLEQKYG